jgi:flagellar basal body P-ring formation protein FlgA
MRLSRFLFSLACLGLALGSARAVEPVTVELNERATVGRALVTVADVAVVSGGDEVTRARVAGLDVAEIKSRDSATTVGKRTVEYRLLLAGFDAKVVRVSGADRATITVARRAVTVEEVTAAARAEVLRQYTNPAEPVAVELAVPVAVKLPEVPAEERVAITAKTRGKLGATGRVQVDMSVCAGGETLLSFAIHLDVRPLSQPGTFAQTGPLAPRPEVAPAGGTQFASGDILIRPRQRVEMQVKTGGLKVTAVGEAQQAGKLGQTILVQNVDSKKVLSGRVTGPGTVEIDLGGAP